MEEKENIPKCSLPDFCNLFVIAYVVNKWEFKILDIIYQLGRHLNEVQC